MKSLTHQDIQYLSGIYRVSYAVAVEHKVFTKEDWVDIVKLGNSQKMAEYMDLCIGGGSFDPRIRLFSGLMGFDNGA